MGLSYRDAVQLGIGHLHPSAGAGKSKERELLDAIYAAEKPTSKVPPSDGMTKLERRFRDNVLEPAWIRGDLSRYYREPMRLVIAGGCGYTPDFLAIVRGEDRPVFVETKGFMREAARVRLCVAAREYPDWRWLLVRRERVAGWLVWEVTARGIGASTIYVPWIHGAGGGR